MKPVLSQALWDKPVHHLPGQTFFPAPCAGAAQSGELCALPGLFSDTILKHKRPGDLSNFSCAVAI